MEESKQELLLRREAHANDRLFHIAAQLEQLEMARGRYFDNQYAQLELDRLERTLKERRTKLRRYKWAISRL